MAQTKTGAESTSSNKKTATELNQLLDANHKSELQRQRFAEANNAIKQLRDYSKGSTKSIGSFSKETLRSYLKNISSNEKNLRNLSWYLYYRSQVYVRIVNFYSNMFCLDCRKITPQFDLTKDFDKNKALKSYQETINWIELLHLQGEFYNILTTAFIQDVFYGIHITDETGTFIYEIPADYARISGKYMSGDFSYVMDASYLRKHAELREYLPDPFETIWKEYDSTGEKWQPIPDEMSICFKFRSEDYETIVPPFSALFNPLINLLDLEDIQAVAAEQEIDKLIWLEMETIAGSKDVDDWKINPLILIEYFNKMVEEALPEYTTTAIVPGKLNEISFNSDISSDTTKVAKATETVLNTAGGAEILNGATINNTFAFKMASIQNTEFAISSLLPQIEGWCNRKLSYLCSNPCSVSFFPISVYTKSDFRDTLLSSGQNGFAVRMALNTLNGFSEKETLAALHFENEILGLNDLMVPLSTSYTQSGSSEIGQGAPKKKEEDLTEEGQRSQNYQ